MGTTKLPRLTSPNNSIACPTPLTTSASSEIHRVPGKYRAESMVRSAVTVWPRASGDVSDATPGAPKNSSKGAKFADCASNAPGSSA